MPFLPSLKDFESLLKLTDKLALPCFAVACIMQPPFRDWPIYTLIGLTSQASVPLFWRVGSMLLLLLLWALASWIGCLAVTIAIQSIAFGLLTLINCVSELSSEGAKTFARIYYSLAATVFLGFGLLALCKLQPHDDPLPALSVFWEKLCSATVLN